MYGSEAGAVFYITDKLGRADWLESAGQAGKARAAMSACVMAPVYGRRLPAVCACMCLWPQCTRQVLSRDGD